MAPLRWGIVSAGKISNDFCTALSTLPAEDHKVVAVAARSEESAKKFSELFKIPRYYEGYEKLIQDDEVDVVYIGSLNHTHLEIGLMMLEGGKHVLCEKPLTLNEKQARQLLQKAEEKKLICFEALWSRFFPTYSYLKKRIENGDLGEIKEVDAEFGFAMLNKSRIVEKQLGGGTVLDLGVYTIQLCQFVFKDEPISIKATGTLNEDGVDIATNVELKYPNGGVGRFRTTASEDLQNNATITGTKGSIKLHWFYASTTLTDIDNSVKEWKLPEPKIGKFFFPNSCGLRYEAEAMRQLFLSKQLECDVVTHEESYRIARIQDEIRRQIGVKYPEDN